MGLGLLNRIRDVLLALALVLLFPPVRSRGAAGTGLRKSPRGILELNFFLCYTEKLAVLYCTVYRDRDSSATYTTVQYSTRRRVSVLCTRRKFQRGWGCQAGHD